MVGREGLHIEGGGHPIFKQHVHRVMIRLVVLHAVHTAAIIAFAQVGHDGLAMQLFVFGKVKMVQPRAVAVVNFKGRIGQFASAAQPSVQRAVDPSGAFSDLNQLTSPKAFKDFTGLPTSQRIMSKSWQDFARMMGAVATELCQFPRTKEWLICTCCMGSKCCMETTLPSTPDCMISRSFSK